LKEKNKIKEQLLEELAALRLEFREQKASRTEFKKAVNEFLLLQTLVHVITDAQDFESAIEIILNRVCETMGWNYGEAWIPNSEKTFLECTAAHYMSDKKLKKFRMISENRSFSHGEGLPGRVWLTRQPEWVPDVSGRSTKFFLRAKEALTAGLKAGYGIPITANDDVLAVIVFFSEKARKKDERLIKLVSGIASELGSVLERKQVEDELHRSRAELEIRVKLSNADTCQFISGSLDNPVSIAKMFGDNSSNASSMEL